MFLKNQSQTNQYYLRKPIRKFVHFSWVFSRLTAISRKLTLFIEGNTLRYSGTISHGIFSRKTGVTVAAQVGDTK